MKDLNEHRRRRGAIIKDMRALTDKADAEKRELTAEESDQYCRMEADQEKLRVEIEREKRQAALDRELESFDREPGRMPEPAAAGERNSNPRATEDYRAQFTDMLCRGYRPGEHRALQADSQVGGGYLVAPEQFVNKLIEALRDQVFIRQLSTVIPGEKATSFGVPVLQTRPDDADWTVELKTGTADTAMGFAKRELHPHPAAKRILVSTFLLNNSVLPADQIVRDQLAYKFGITQENAARDGKALVAEVERMASLSVSFDNALQELGVILHRAALLQLVPDAVAQDDPDRGDLEVVCGLFAPDELQLFYQIATQGRADLPLAPDEVAGFTMTLLRMLAFVPQESPPQEGTAPAR